EGVRSALLRGGVHPDRIRVVPSGIDPAALEATPEARSAVRTEWGVHAGEVVVLVLGALERRKGHAVLLDAARRLAIGHPGLRYVFAGEGSERAALTGAARVLGDRVVFAGFPRGVAACLAAADVVALPSLQEGLGVAALEAMAAGRAVVASRVGGLAEVVVEGETGLFAEAGEPRSLATALAAVADDATLRAQLGEGGPCPVLARYPAARMAEGTIACYGGTPCAA